MGKRGEVKRGEAPRGDVELLAPEGFTVPARDWFESLSYALTWTDKATTETAYNVQADDGSGFTTVKSLSANTESYTLTEADVDYNTDYTLRIQVSDGTTTKVSGTVSITTPLLDVANQTGYWLALVGGSNAADRRAETDTIAGRTLDFAREHTALSDFKSGLAYDESLEAERFSECHLYFDSEHLFAGEVQTIESDAGGGLTTLSGPGAPGAKLQRGSASVRYQNELAWKALQDYLDNHSNIGGTVTSPVGSASTVNDQDLQDADTTAEFNGVISHADNIPLENRNGNVELLQTSWTTDSNSLTHSNTNLEQDANYAGGEAEEIAGSTGHIELSFTPEHDIPASAVQIWVRSEAPTDSPEIQVTLNGVSWSPVSDGAILANLNWRDLANDTFGGSGSYTGAGGGDLQAGTTYTVELDGQTAGTGFVVDVLAPLDAGGSRFTPNYTFDNDNGGSDGHLDGPEHYPPGGVRAVFNQTSTAYRITAVSITASLDDTSGSQALGWSVDGGSTWTDTSNTSSITDDPVSTPSTTLTGSAILAAYGTQSTTPKTGINGQKLQSWDLDFDGDTVGVIEDETVNGDHLTNIQRLCGRVGVRFYLDHDPDETQWSVEAFAEGDRVHTASWATANRVRTVDVGGYANRIIMRGALKNDGTGERYTADVKDDAEITDFDEEILREPPPDPSLTSVEAVRSEARTRLNNAIDEDTVRGDIDILPEALAPGVSYQVEAWNGVYDGRYGYEQYGQATGGEPPTLALERLTYQVRSRDAVGRLSFQRPGGLGDAVSDVEGRARNIGDAV